MTFRRQALKDIGGLEALVDYLADDYQLGNPNPSCRVAVEAGSPVRGKHVET